MKNVIIGIHGLSNKPEPQILKKGWKDAILEGLKKNAGIHTKTRLNDMTTTGWILYGKKLRISVAILLTI